MNQARKNLIPRNEGFLCEACGALVSPAAGTSRNHCPKCLTSKHVDTETPGDRLNQCRGLMPAVAYEGTDPDRLDLIHQCERCGASKRNRVAPDDDRSKVLALLEH